MRIVIRHFPTEKKPCLVLEQDNQCVVLASFRNIEMGRLYKMSLGGNTAIELYNEKRDLDEMLQEVYK